MRAFSNSGRRGRLRSAISTWFLDLAEDSDWDFEIVRELQRLRAEHRRDGDRIRSEYSIPSGTDVHFERLTLIDVIAVENLAPLQAALVDLMPQASDEERFGENFQSLFRSAYHGGSVRVGQLIRPGDRPPIIGPFKTTLLPEHVSRIDLELRRFLPSFALLVIDVILDASATSKFLDILSTAPLPDFRIKQWRLFPPEVLGWHSRGRSIRDQATTWIDEIQVSVEGIVRTNYLSATSRASKPRLPSIRSFSLKTTSMESDTLSVWLKNNRGWLRGLGFSGLPFGVYEHTNAAVSFSPLAGGERWGDRTVVVTLGTSRENKKLRQKLVDSIIPALTILDWIVETIDTVEELRIEAFGLISADRRRKPFSSYLRLNASVELHAIALDRLVGELEHDLKAVLAAGGGIDITLSDKTIERFVKPDFYGAAIDAVNHVIGLIRPQTSQMRKAFSAVMSTRNMDATYRVQRLALALAVIAILANLSGLVNLAKMIYRACANLF